MAPSLDTRMWAPPEAEIDFFGFEAKAWQLQRAGWKFEEMAVGPDRDNPFRRGRQLVMRHQSGLIARATCDEELWMRSVRDSLGYSRADVRPIFVVQQVAPKASEMIIHAPATMLWNLNQLDMEPYPRVPAMRRFSLAEVYPPEAEEIIVEPATVSSLLEQIKQLQAPELARIREANRRREARERAAEVRHATILTLAA